MRVAQALNQCWILQRAAQGLLKCARNVLKERSRPRGGDWDTTYRIKASLAEATIVDRGTAGSHALSDSNLMPALSALSFDGWATPRRPVTSTQLNSCTTDFLVTIDVFGDVANMFGSHSCKSNMLSWLGKASVCMADRRLLGGHAKLGEQMPLTCSCDASASR